MAKQERYFIGPRLLADIREVITRVDAIPMTTSGVEQPVRHQHMGRRGGGSSGGFHIATFTGAWSKNTAKVVTLTSDTNSTIQASNVFASIAASNNQGRKCAIAKDGTAWYLIQTECP